MWPLLLDLSRDESKRILRRLELEAYSSLVSAFRAQGILTKYKKKLLQELQHALSISTERHRAEVRRAVNDEQLSTIADNMCGPSTDADWLIEGRRLIPLMPRLVPQTAFTVTANQAVNLQVEKNAAMPNPAQTGNKDWGTIEEEEESFTKKRRHAASDSISSVSAGTQTSRAATTSSSNNLQGISPVKITISKNSQTRNQNTNAVATQTQKVILVSTSGPGANGGANVLPKSISLPLVKAIPTTSVSGTGSGHPKMSIVMPNTNSTPAGITISNGNLGNIITVVTTSNTSLRSTSTNTTAVLGTSSTAFLPSSINIPKNRPKSVPKQKVPQLGQKPGVVIPVGAQSSHSTSGNMSVQGIQIKPAAKSAIQIKHEGGMKIITQSIPTPGSKILPKPTPSGTPVVVVSGVSNTTTATTVSMVTRPVSTISGENVKRALGIQVSQAGNSKILNINTQGGKVITTTKTANPKTLHLTAVKSASGGTVSRPNVIVVTKAPPKRPGIPLVTGITKGTTSSVLPSSFEKELVSFIHKQDTRNNPSNISTLKSPIEKKIIVTTTVPESLKSRHPQAQVTEGDGTGKTSSLLAELIQAAGILPDNLSSESTNTVAAAATTTTATPAISVTDVAIAPDSTVEVIQGSNAFPSTTAQAKLSDQPLSSNEWFEYDVTDDQPQSYSNDSNDAIAALLEMQHQSNSSNIQLKEKDVPISNSALELSNLSEQQHFYTIEQAMTILSQEEKESVTSISSSAESLDGFLTPSAIPISVPKQLNEQIQVISTTTSPSSSTTTTSATSTTALNQITCTSTKGASSAKFMAFTSKDSNTKNNSSSASLSFSLSSTTPTSSLSSSSSSKVLDLLSSSLEQAQIDLHTYQFIEDIDNFNKKTVVQTVPINSKGSVLVQGSNIELAAVSTSLLANPAKKGLTQQLNCLEENTLPKIETGTNLNNEKISAKKADKNGPICNDKNPCPNLEPKAPLGIPEKKMGITADYLQAQEEVVTDLKQLSDKAVEIPTNTASSLSAEVDNVHHEIITKKIHTKLGTSLSLSSTPEIISVDAHIDANSAYQKKDVELNSENLDQLNVKNVDFLCKESLDEISLGSPAGTEFGSSSDSQGDGSYCGDLNPVRVSQRKRKPPASLDDNPSPSSRGGWVRIALSLLERVSRYRGANREKRELNAASWFNRPVDPLEAPDYYTIVKKPMDFSRIRKNLESGHYGTLEDFHNDMLLVRSNCNLYNPMESSVQKDCEEVFTFYIQEYEKMVEKWQKSRVPYAQPHAPSVAKKVKTDKISTKS